MARQGAAVPGFVRADGSLLVHGGQAAAGAGSAEKVRAKGLALAITVVQEQA